MITVRKSLERGHARHGWLESRHTFSFAGYHDPAHMGFRDLRVLNEDRVQPGHGFDTHAHHDMEIVTYVLEGALAHKDSMGNGSIIHPGEVQRMSAGTGVRHSEFNASDTEIVRFLQIWIFPERTRIAPSYEQKRFGAAGPDAPLRLVVSRQGREGSIKVHQDVDLYTGRLAPGQEAEIQIRPGRHAWVQVARGAVNVNGSALDEGDGAALSDEARLVLTAARPSEVLVFDLR